MKMNHFVLPLACALGLALGVSGAHAAQLLGVGGASANVVTDYSTDALMSFDLDWAALSPVTLDFTVDAGDIANGALYLNALVRNVSGQALEGATFTLSGTNFAIHGTFATDGFTTIVGSGTAQKEGWVTFAPGLTSEFYLGNPLGLADARDWGISLQGLDVGSRITLTVAAVPEPASYAMLLSGLGLMGLAIRRRQRG